MMKRLILPALLLTLFGCNVYVADKPDVNVVKPPDVNIVKPPDVNVIKPPDINIVPKK